MGSIALNTIATTMTTAMATTAAGHGTRVIRTRATKGNAAPSRRKTTLRMFHQRGARMSSRQRGHFRIATNGSTRSAGRRQCGHFRVMRIGRSPLPETLPPGPQEAINLGRRSRDCRIYVGVTRGRLLPERRPWSVAVDLISLVDSLKDPNDSWVGADIPNAVQLLTPEHFKNLTELSRRSRLSLDVTGLVAPSEILGSCGDRYTAARAALAVDIDKAQLRNTFA